MNISLLSLAIIGTLFSLIMGALVFRQVYKSRWVDSRAITVFWFFLAIILLSIVGLWGVYIVSL